MTLTEWRERATQVLASGDAEEVRLLIEDLVDRLDELETDVELMESYARGLEYDVSMLEIENGS